MPMLSLSTDIICGFPGETDQEFNDTVELAQRCRFTKIHVFPYSKRQGTPAAERADQIEPRSPFARAKQLREVADAFAPSSCRIAPGQRSLHWLRRPARR